MYSVVLLIKPISPTWQRTLLAPCPLGDQTRNTHALSLASTHVLRAQITSVGGKKYLSKFRKIQNPQISAPAMTYSHHW